jgi:hypothetical protein
MPLWDGSEQPYKVDSGINTCASPSFPRTTTHKGGRFGLTSTDSYIGGGGPKPL